MNWETATKDELKHSAFRVILIFAVYLFIFSIFFFFISRSIIMCIFILIGGFSAAFYYAILIYKSDWIDEKIGLFSKDFPGISYQAMVLFLSVISIALSIGFFGIALVKSGIYSAIAFSITIIFPTVFMLLRINVYRNENSRLLLVKDEFGNQYYEQVFGYNPVYYYLIGIILSRGNLGVYLHNILDSIFLHTKPLTINLFLFILSLIVGCILLSPDLCNRILPFELKTFDGVKKFFIISIFIIGLILLIDVI